jgi:hypothetical protein
LNPEDIQSFAGVVLEAVKSGNWRYVAALLVVATVFWGGRALQKKAPFFGTSKGKAVLTILSALSYGAATAFAAGHVPGLGEVIAALGVALSAAGGFSLFKAFFE